VFTLLLVASCSHVCCLVSSLWLFSDGVLFVIVWNGDLGLAGA
jgi:hypothetical protein